jgi:hypothetical protein
VHDVIVPMRTDVRHDVYGYWKQICVHGSEWAVSRLGRFTSWERVRDINGIRFWDSRSGNDGEERNSCSYWESNPRWCSP